MWMMGGEGVIYSSYNKYTTVMNDGWISMDGENDGYKISKHKNKSSKISKTMSECPRWVDQTGNQHEIRALPPQKKT